MRSIRFRNIAAVTIAVMLATAAGYALWARPGEPGGEAAAGGLNFAGWNSGTPQAPGMWFQVELPQPVMLTEVQFDSPMQRLRRAEPPNAGGQPGPPVFVSTAPAAYRVEISLDGRSWSAPVAEGEGTGNSTVIPFAPTQARHLRIMRTGDGEGDTSWAMQRLRLFTRQEQR